MFSFTTIEFKAFGFFCFDTQKKVQEEKLIPPKSSSLCVALLTNRYVLIFI